MQQHRQLARGRNDRPLLAVLATAFCQSQSPSSQVAISTKRSQDVVRRLHQHRPQIGITLFADVHLRLALPRVSTPRLQTGVATRVATLAEAMWVFQRQQVGQGDQRAYSLHLLLQRRLRIALFGDLLDLLVVLGDALAQCFQRL